MNWVLFYDGDCAFCSASVRRVFLLDKRGHVSFAPLQGELAHGLGLEGHANERGGSMVLLREDDGALFIRTDALLELSRVLGWPWRLARFAAIIPRRWRDGIYQWMADHRRDLFGESDACHLPDARLAEKLRGQPSARS